MPLHLSVSQVMRMGGQLMSFQLGAGRNVEGPGIAPDWGLRFTTTLMFPTR